MPADNPQEKSGGWSHPVVIAALITAVCGLIGTIITHQPSSPPSAVNPPTLPNSIPSGIGSGTPDEKIAIPNLKGESNVSAAEDLAQAGLDNFRAENVTSSKKFGTVVSVDPPSGTEVSPSDRIVIYISSGPRL